MKKPLYTINVYQTGPNDFAYDYHYHEDIGPLNAWQLGHAHAIGADCLKTMHAGNVVELRGDDAELIPYCAGYQTGLITPYPNLEPSDS